MHAGCALATRSRCARRHAGAAQERLTHPPCIPETALRGNPVDVPSGACRICRAACHGTPRSPWQARPAAARQARAKQRGRIRAFAASRATFSPGSPMFLAIHARRLPKAPWSCACTLRSSPSRGRPPGLLRNTTSSRATLSGTRGRSHPLSKRARSMPAVTLTRHPAMSGMPIQSVCDPPRQCMSRGRRTENSCFRYACGRATAPALCEGALVGVFPTRRAPWTDTTAQRNVNPS